MPTFPGTVSPAVWHDGNQQAYSDLAGTAPVTSGLIRRLNEAAPLTGAWTTVSDAQRPLRDSNAVRYEAATAVGYSQLTRPAVGGMVANACTLVCSYVGRDGAFGAQTEGAFQAIGNEVGIRMGATIFVYYCDPSTGIGQNFFTSLTLAPGKKNTIGVRYSTSGIDVWLDVEGQSRVTQSFTVAIPATAIASSWDVGFNGANVGPMYGSCSQAFAVARALTDLELDACMVWAEAQNTLSAYSNDRALFVWAGDSIQRGVGNTYGLGYPFLVLAGVRAAGFLAENCVVAVPGNGVAGLTDLTATDGFKTMLRRGAAFYSPTRTYNIMVFCLGTNDLASGNGPAFVLNGTGLGVPGSGLYPACDYARSLGFKVVLMTIGPRSNAMSVSQGQYNADRATVNADILANWRLHADAVIDTTQVTHWGFDGDSNNPTYYSSDLIHPLDAAHALVASIVTAALVGLLSATPPAPHRISSIYTFPGGSGGIALALAAINSQFGGQLSALTIAVSSGGGATRVSAIDLASLNTALAAAAPSASSTIILAA